MRAIHLPRPLVPTLVAVLLMLGTSWAEERSAGWLGVMLVTASGEGSGAADGLAEPPGVRVRFVVEDSPAAAAGLRARDEILDVNGTPVQRTEDLLAQLRREAPGNWIPMTVRRDGHERDVRVRLDSRPSDMRRLKMRRGWLGIQTIHLTPSLREHFGAPEDAGVMVAEVTPGSPAEAAGLVVGDVVYEIDGEPVASNADLQRRVAGGGVGNEIELVVARSGSEMVLEAVLELAPSK